MRFIANAPRRLPDGTLVWRARWAGTPKLLVALVPLIAVGSQLSGDGPPVLAFVAFGLAIGCFWMGPGREVLVDPTKREISLLPYGFVNDQVQKVVSFDQVQELIVGDDLKGPRLVLIRTAEGQTELLALTRVYANEQALGELRAIFKPRGAPEASTSTVR